MHQDTMHFSFWESNQKYYENNWILCCHKFDISLVYVRDILKIFSLFQYCRRNLYDLVQITKILVFCKSYFYPCLGKSLQWTHSLRGDSNGISISVNTDLMILYPLIVIQFSLERGISNHFKKIMEKENNKDKIYYYWSPALTGKASSFV